jgi:hypothetical protein
MRPRLSSCLCASNAPRVSCVIRNLQTSACRKSLGDAASRIPATSRAAFASAMARRRASIGAACFPENHLGLGRFMTNSTAAPTKHQAARK